MILYYIIFTLAVIVIVLYSLWQKSVKKLQKALFSKQSIATRHGKMAEQFMPFLEKYPYDSGNFRFLGTPIDGVQFENNEIILVEFKTSSSQLSTTQRRIKQLIDNNRVRFEEIRI